MVEKNMVTKVAEYGVRCKKSEDSRQNAVDSKQTRERIEQMAALDGSKRRSKRMSGCRQQTRESADCSQSIVA